MTTPTYIHSATVRISVALHAPIYVYETKFSNRAMPLTYGTTRDSYSSFARARGAAYAAPPIDHACKASGLTFCFPTEDPVGLARGSASSAAASAAVVLGDAFLAGAALGDAFFEGDAFFAGLEAEGALPPPPPPPLGAGDRLRWLPASPPALAEGGRTSFGRILC